MKTVGTLNITNSLQSPQEFDVKEFDQPRYYESAEECSIFIVLQYRFAMRLMEYRFQNFSLTVAWSSVFKELSKKLSAENMPLSCETETYPSHL